MLDALLYKCIPNITLFHDGFCFLLQVCIFEDGPCPIHYGTGTFLNMDSDDMNGEE